MDLELRGKVALVAAASKGMGKATAKRFAQEGASVAICARGQEDLEATASEIQQATGAKVLAVQADLSVAGDVQKVVESTLAQYGRIDALVCNAGGPPALRFEDATEHDWSQALDLSLHSTMRLVRQTLPTMLEAWWRQHRRHYLHDRTGTKQRADSIHRSPVGDRGPL